jgi:hypothetical protein
MEEKRNTCIILLVKPEGKNHSEDIGVDGKITLEWILGNRVRGCGLDSCGLG